MSGLEPVLIAPDVGRRIALVNCNCFYASCERVFDRAAPLR